MERYGTLLIALAIFAAGSMISDAVRSLSSLHVEMRTMVRFADGAEGHGAP